MQVQVTLDRDLQAVIRRLETMPVVTKVIPGSFSHSPHTFKAGDVKVVRRTAHGLDIRAYSSKGMANMHIYGDPAQLEDALKPAPVLKKPKAARLPLPSESRIKREVRKQPVYPTQPAPMKTAASVSGTEVRGQLMSVTPDIAVNWLERNTRNRRLRDVDVAKYAADMKAGRWMAGGAIIKFDINSNIVNGQHVLWAIIESGQTIELFVMRGLDPNVVLVEDDHARRTLVDAIHIAQPGRTITNRHTSCATLLRHSLGWALGRPISFENIPRQEQIAFLDEHRSAIDLACSLLNGAGRGIDIAAVVAAVARASYTVDHDTLRRFARVLANGLVQSPDENAAVLLRNWLMSSVGTVSNTMLSRQDAYRRVERALSAYIKGEAMKQLKPTAEELFPLPTEKTIARKR